MKVSETEQGLSVEDTWWGMIVLLWIGGLLPLLLILRYGIGDLPFKLVTIPVLVFASGLLIYSAAQISLRSRWHFDFAANVLNWSQRGPFIRRGGTIAIPDIEKLFIQADSGIAPDSKRYRLAVVHANGLLPLTPYYLRDSANYDKLKGISLKISSHMERLKIDDDETIRDLLARQMRTAALRQARIMHKLTADEAEAYLSGIEGC
ncbi:hypothetical protein Ga0123462_1070 [Mariprofundus ferrinatatus]|uniref:Uncharacterized protein n=1 Tax=Mariprofundus ferrinatatus TaxID=1921087 RepID=A0A2K8LCC1_9PROT|nr:hypothetical protein [Mariprofundus ferrinatatus]ATX81936.1 hypothetical protein Ga0123462_1070 [Mariprofundus ferrinatatus]